MHIYRVRNETFCFSHGDCVMHRVTQLGSSWCCLYLNDSDSRLDGDLSEPRTGGGGWGGSRVYLYYMSNNEAWPIFSGRLTKVDGRVVHSLVLQLSER